MTLPTSGPLTLAQIQAEFGGTGPLSDYYRGGPHVSSGVAIGSGSYQTDPLTPATGVQIPSSGPLQMSMFYGTSAFFSGQYVSASVDTLSPASVSATVVFSSDGSTHASNFPTVPVTNWYSPTTTGIIAGYWFRTTVTSGALQIGNTGLGSWHAVSSTSNWTIGCSASTGGPFASAVKNAYGYVDIATDALGANIVAHWPFAISVTLESNA